MAKGTNKKLQKCDGHCMVLVNAHRTGEGNKFAFPFPCPCWPQPNQMSASFHTSHTQSSGSARPLSAWFLPHTVRISGQRKHRPGQARKQLGGGSSSKKAGSVSVPREAASRRVMVETCSAPAPPLSSG